MSAEHTALGELDIPPLGGFVVKEAKSLLSLKVVVAAALLVVGWTGGRYTSGAQRQDDAERILRRLVPVVAFLGREKCADIPEVEWRRRAPLCRQLLDDPDYLAQPIAQRDGTAIIASRALRP